MPPVPKKKTAKSRTQHRRGNIKLPIPNVSKCKNCGELKEPHVACPSCRQTEKVINTKSETKDTKK